MPGLPIIWDRSTVRATAKSTGLITIRTSVLGKARCPARLGEIMSKTTRATLTLQKLGLSFKLHSYDYAPGADGVGLQAAEALGQPPNRVLKTLMIEVDGRPACIIIRSDREVSMKRAAAAFGGKSARMMRPADAERLTGYHVGGISPFGQKRLVPTRIDSEALNEPYVFVNAGQRGLQLELDPQQIANFPGFAAAPLAAD
jgi:Cys-tRNA(Pro)/Cys-tRNA(Cys) deacylase